MTRNHCVLFVSPGPDLVTPTSGEGTRLKQLSKRLAAKEGWAVVALVPQATTSSIPWAKATYTYRQWSVPFLTDVNPSFVGALTTVLRDQIIDVVHLSKGVCLAKALTALRRHQSLVAYAAQNVEADHAQDFVAPDLPVYKRVLGPRLIPLIERATVWCADCVIAVSDADRDRLIARYRLPTGEMAVIPTGTMAVDWSSLPDPATVRAELGITAETVAVFHGSYAHPPNREAVELITEYIAPAINKRDIDVAFLLVGKGMPDVDVPNVYTTGFVEDLYAVLHAADIAIVPIHHGGGTKTKLYDYLSLHLPIVSTSSGVTGIDLEHGVHAHLTENVDDAFIDGLCKLVANPSYRETLRTNLRDVTAEFSWDRSIDNLVAFYETRLAKQP